MKYSTSILAIALLMSGPARADRIVGRYAASGYRKAESINGKLVYQFSIGSEGDYAIELRLKTMQSASALQIAVDKEAASNASVAADSASQYQRVLTKRLLPGWHVLTASNFATSVELNAFRLVQLAASAPVVVPPPPPPPPPPPVVSQPAPPLVTSQPPSGIQQLLTVGQYINYGGAKWGVQTPGITLTGNEFHFHASTGEFANFDPVDGRKIRNELCAIGGFGKGVLSTTEFDIVVNAPTPAHKDLQWFSIFQIHQADTRDANGVPIPGSPLFAMDLQPSLSGNGYDVKITGASTTSMTGGFPPERLFGRVPFSIGVKHHVKAEVIDSHGQVGVGMIRVTLDGVVIANAVGIAVGHAYVDNGILLGGRKQSSDAYLKMGIYAGNQFRPAPVTLETFVSNFNTRLD